MRVRLVMEDWRRVGTADSIYQTERGLALSAGDLHAGTVIHATLTCDDGAVHEAIIDAWDTDRSYPVFRVLQGDVT